MPNVLAEVFIALEVDAEIIKPGTMTGMCSRADISRPHSRVLNTLKVV